MRRHLSKLRVAGDEGIVRVRERDMDRLRGAASFPYRTRVVQLVVSELDRERDDRDGDDGDARDRLRRASELFEVDRRDEPVQVERLLTRSNRTGIVLAGPAH